MLTDAEIRTSALKLHAEGITPSVRKIATDLGGGDWSRIARILRELNLTRPIKPTEPPLPAYTVSALKKLQDEAYARGKAETMRLVDEQRQTIAMLESQVVALTAAIANSEAAGRIASPQQIRSIMQGTLADFLGEVRPRPIKQPRKAPRKRIPRNNWQETVIDGLPAAKIFVTKVGDLTPAQLEWKRQYHRECDARRRAHREA